MDYIHLMIPRFFCDSRVSFWLVSSSEDVPTCFIKRSGLLLMGDLSINSSTNLDLTSKTADLEGTTRVGRSDTCRRHAVPLHWVPYEKLLVTIASD